WGERPRICAKLGALAPDASAAAPRSGAISATAAQASDRSQSPTVRLSSGTFATVQPISVPDIIAIAASRSHQPMLATAAVRPRTASAVPKIKVASPTPPAACQGQCGWLETAPPQTNLARRP